MNPTADEGLVRLHSAALAVSDTVCVILAIVVATITVHDFPVALATVVALELVAVLCGRYRRTFSVRSSDEISAAIACALIASPIPISLALVSGANVRAAVVAIAIWSLAASVGGMLLYRSRSTRRATDAGYDLVPDRRNRVLDDAALRVLDVVGSFIGIVVFAPIMAIVAFAVLCDSGSPVLFRQERVGQGGRPFTMYKFRTMRNDAGDAWVRPGDSRITRLGAFLRRSSLDELPQLFNVFRGEMSLVGPRPEMSEYADAFIEERPAYRFRHLVPPGITGWAQLHLARNLQPSDMPVVLRYDFFYVQNASVYLYVFCIVKTVLEVATHRAV